MSPDRIIELLGLEPHPEGGRFAETWVGEAVRGRAAGTAIYFLLAADEVSHWHRVDAAEVWHHYGGSPLELSTAADPERPEVDVHRLGADLEAGERPQFVVPASTWQSARSLGEWSLVGCTVSPGFEFEGFELAPAGWAPGEVGPS